MKSDIAIIGIGNTLRGDDGIGPVVAREFARQGFSTYVLGDDLTEMLDIFDRHNKSILVDAFASPQPGVHLELDLHEVSQLPQELNTSTHSMNLGKVLELAQTLNKIPKKLRLFALSGQRFDIGSDLSKEVLQCLPEFKKHVNECIKKWESEDA